MNLAEESMAPDEDSSPGAEANYVPEQFKVPVTPELEGKLHENYVGENVRVYMPGYKGSAEWVGVLEGIYQHNGQLVLDLGDTLLPWNQCRGIVILPAVEE